MKNPDKMTGDQMLNWLNSLHKWDGGIRNPEFKNDVRKNNWALINKFPLANLQNTTGYVPDEEDTDDPYNRVIDPDMDHAMQTDLSQPIVVSSDRTTVLDGNHRVAKAREMGKTHLPAYFPMIKENKSDDGDEGNWEYFMQQLKASGWPQNGTPNADVDGKLVDLLNDPKAGKEHKEQIRKYFNFLGGFDTAIPGDVIDQEQLGKVTVLKIIGKDMYNMPAEYLVKTQKGSQLPITFDELVLGNEYGSETEIGGSKLMNSLDLKLVNQEISEARLYRTTRNFNALTGEDVTKLFYLTSLSTYMMLNDDKQYEYAKEYIKQTVQYGPYTLFRSHATDLYLLGYLIKNPDTKSINLKNPISSKQYLNKINFDARKHYSFYMRLQNSTVKGTEFNSYFLRLESQLKIKDQKYRQWRRLIADWANLKYSSRQLVVTRLLQEYRRLGRGSEMVSPLSTMAKYKAYSPSKYQEPKTSLAKRAAGTVAGAAAGRYVGKKIAKKLGKDIDKYKKYGTGIGAVAGYWASGRKKI
jgi:hypothetical protein